MAFVDDLPDDGVPGSPMRAGLVPGTVQGQPLYAPGWPRVATNDATDTRIYDLQTSAGILWKCSYDLCEVELSAEPAGSRERYVAFGESTPKARGDQSRAVPSTGRITRRRGDEAESVAR